MSARTIPAQHSVWSCSRRRGGGGGAAGCALCIGAVRIVCAPGNFEPDGSSNDTVALTVPFPPAAAARPPQLLAALKAQWAWLAETAAATASRRAQTGGGGGGGGGAPELWRRSAGGAEGTPAREVSAAGAGAGAGLPAPLVFELRVAATTVRPLPSAY